MESSLIIAAGASFVAGLLGYVIARLWIKPILRYRITKRKLGHELTRYLAQMNKTAGPERRARKKQDDASLRTARKHAMDLAACYCTDIPYWYRLLLDSRKASPTQVSGLLTNLSKIKDQEQVKNRIDRARKAIGLG